jgi:hypothetical protein
MWTSEHSMDSPARLDAIWPLCADVSQWSSWSVAIDAVRLDGPFAGGTTGSITPSGQDELPLRMIEVVDRERYTSETEVSDSVRLRMTHVFTALPDGGTRIWHETAIVGPGAEYFAESFGDAMTSSVPKSLAALSEQALQKGQVGEEV